MKYLSLLFLVALIIVACQSSNKDTATAPPTLTLKWQTDTLLTTSESVIYDKANNVLYVSNIAGAPDGKDGNGFISKVSLDGKITEAQWVKGLDAPKGLGLWSGKLFVADIDKIVEIDIASGAISNSYPVEGAKFLNDITVDDSGGVFVSDMNNGDVILLKDGSVSKWLSGQDSPNGLLSDGSTMLIALWNAKTLNTIDGDKQVVVKTDSLDNPDGIEAVGNGGYLVSSWNGMIHYIDPNWNRTLILDTRADSISAADIEYIQEKNLLLIPTFGKNSVMAYELSK